MKIKPSKPCRHRIFTVLLTSAIFGYGSALYALAHFRLASASHEPSHSGHTARRISYGEILEKHQSGSRQALRIRADPERRRLWVLTPAHVYVYDTRKLELIRRISLPDWSVADIMCPPDMVLDRGGTAFVSNNVQPRLLQIDPADFRKKEHRLRLISERTGWEIGFGGLAFGADGTLFALTALAGSLFRIDLASGNASEIVLSEPVAGACDLMNSGQSRRRTQLRAVSLRAGFDNRSRRIDISPGLTHGYVANPVLNDLRP